MSDIRVAQIEHLKKLGYQFEEKDIPFPDKKELEKGIAVLVDYETSIDEQCRKLGIKSGLKFLRHGNCYSNSTGRWSWIYQAVIKVEGGKAINSDRSKHADGAYGYCGTYRDLMTAEGLAFYRENPELFRNRIVDFLGSVCELGGLRNYNPSLCWNGGNPELDSNYVEIWI